jgi:hypothetical protein
LKPEGAAGPLLLTVTLVVPLAETLANVTVTPPVGVTDTLVPEGVSPFTLKYFAMKMSVAPAVTSVVWFS